MREYSKRLLAIGAAMLVFLTGFAVANARHSATQNNVRAMRDRSMRMFAPGMFLRGLNLTPQQRDQIKAVVSEHKIDTQKVMRENADARKALGDDLFKGADQATLQTDFNKVSSAGWNAVLLGNRIWSEIRQKNILTPDQMTTLQQRHDRMDERMQTFLNRMNGQAGGK